MIKHTGDLQQAVKELKLQPTAVAHIFSKATINQTGPLAKAVVTLKDLFATKDGPTQGSSKILENFCPFYDATVVTKLKAAGATIVAKVHSDELGLGGSGEFNPYGTIVNALDAKRIVGGSSSGSVATMTKAISLAIGTDTGDSTRLPASYHGLVGWKPSYGAISRYGVFPYASSLDTVGIFAHNVHDAIVASKVLFGQDTKDMSSRTVPVPALTLMKPKSVAILDHQEVLDPHVAAKLKTLVQRMEADGVAVTKVRIDQKLLDSIEIVYDIISYSEAASNDANLSGIIFGKRVEGTDWATTMTKTRTAKFGQMVQRRFTLGSWFLSTANQTDIFLRAQKVRRLISDAFAKALGKHDLLIFPATSVAPLRTDQKINNWYASYLIHANLSGAPSLSIPFTKVGELPVGLALTASLYQDQALLSHALYLEQLWGGQDV